MRNLILLLILWPLLVGAKGTYARTYTNYISETDTKNAYTFNVDFDSKVIDDSGNNHLGGFLSAPVFTASCKVGGCLDFDGTDDEVQIQDSTDFDSDTSFSIGAWIYIDAYGALGEQYIHTIYSDSADPGDLNSIGIRLGDGTDANKDKFGLYFRNTGAAWSQHWDDTALSTTTWYHAFATYDGSNFRFYINGVLSDTDAETGTPVSFTQTHQFGSENDSRHWDGKIDEFIYSGRVYSATEILDIYENGLR